jgi:hypothetical protein
LFLSKQSSAAETYNLLRSRSGQVSSRSGWRSSGHDHSHFAEMVVISELLVSAWAKAPEMGTTQPSDPARVEQQTHLDVPPPLGAAGLAVPGEFCQGGGVKVSSASFLLSIGFMMRQLGQSSV